MNSFRQIATLLFLPFFSAMANDEDAAQLRRDLIRKPPLSEFQITYHFVNNNEITGPERPNPGGVSTAGIIEYEARYVSGPDFFANYNKGNVSDFWEVRRWPVGYFLHAGESLTIVNDPGFQTRNFDVLAREAIGSFGLPPRSIVGELMGPGLSITEKDDTLVLQNGKVTVVLERSAEGNRVRSFERVEPDYQQVERTVFEDYREVSGHVIPCKVTTIFQHSEGKVTRHYAIKDLILGAEPKVPFIDLPLAKITHVLDCRYDPPVKYLTKSDLPSDAQIARWIIDPEALKKHNSSVYSWR